MLLFCAATTCVVAFRAIPRTSGSGPTEASIQVVHWNMSSPDLLNFQGTLADFPACKSADVVLLGVNVPHAQLQYMVAGLGKEWTFSRVGVFAVASRFEILNISHHALGLEIDSSQSGEPGFQNFYNEKLADRFGISRREFNLPDPGHVLETCVRTPNRDTVIRLIDLPSNPFRSRMSITTAAASRIAALEGTRLLVPHPDVLIGDCNIPSGSASLGFLSRDMIAAETISKSGDCWPTWPRAMPVLRIDHAWVTSGTKVWSYRTFDGGISDHRGQSITLSLPVTSNPQR